MKLIFEELDATPSVRAIVLTGEGKHFTAGIDVCMLMDVTQYQGDGCESRKREAFNKNLQHLQDCVSAIEKCRKPTLAAIDNACIGGGIDISCACDMRYATEAAYFSIKEIDWGMVADLGTLQRMPRIVPYAIVAELAYTGRKFGAQEAQQIGFVNRVFPDKDALMEGVMELAQMIAAKSPVSIRGTKEMLLYTRDHDVNDALNYQKVWNAAMIMSQDLMEAGMANMQKRKAEFAD
ncbi:MAG: crotonase/enoyl-CoA hydratase family protein, partial [Saprospiraceae bacterium]